EALERPGARSVAEAGRDVVRQAEILAYREEQAAAHAVAEDRVEHAQRPRVGVVAMQGRDANRDLRLARVATTGPYPGTGGQRGRRREAGDGPVATSERAGDQ